MLPCTPTSLNFQKEPLQGREEEKQEGIHLKVENYIQGSLPLFRLRRDFYFIKEFLQEKKKFVPSNYPMQHPIS